MSHRILAVAVAGLAALALAACQPAAEETNEDAMASGDAMAPAGDAMAPAGDAMAPAGDSMTSDKMASGDKMEAADKMAPADGAMAAPSDKMEAGH